MTAVWISPENSGVAAFPYGRFGVGGRFDQPQTSLGFDYVASGVVPFQFSSGLKIFLSGGGFLGIIDVSQPILSMGVDNSVPILGSGTDNGQPAHASP